MSASTARTERKDPMAMAICHGDGDGGVAICLWLRKRVSERRRLRGQLGC